MISAQEPRLVLSRSVSFRVLSPEVVEATIGGAPQELAIELYRLALEFSSPRSVAEVHAELETDGGVADIEQLVEPLVQRGLLGREDEIDLSLKTLLHTETFADPTLLERIGRAVGEGHAVVIPNALDEAFAERAHAELARTSLWRPYERLTSPFFHFRHHNIYEEAHFPAEMRECRRIFDGRGTKDLLTRLTGIDCNGPLTLGASLYLPGDYSLPHTDAMGARSVAYVWYLTKGWRADWGGHFVWCPTGAVVNPTFNSLAIFPVNETSLHFVAPVAPHALGRRMAVNGWWQSATASSRQPAPPADWPVPMMAGTYGGGTRTLEGRKDVVVL